MANKAPKKRESREQVNQISASKEANITASAIAEERKRKPPIPLWVEWSDQDIAVEKWDNGKREKDRGRSPTSVTSYFEDAEGKIDLPGPLKSRVHSWKRPCEIFNEKVPTMLNPDYAYEPNIDLLSPNEHITDSELIRHIISTFTSLYQIFSSSNEPEAVSSIIKMKASISKDNKDAKTEKGGGRREDIFDEMGWRPWYQIWPKEGAKGNNVPSYNPQGKYAVKIFWMGCYRKIIVDDTVPCDEDLKPLLPLTSRGNEIWPLILTKALIKVASLDYYGGLSSSEFGDSNIIHCLTGWLPESIPLETKNSEKIWKLLLSLLPHWKLPLPQTQKYDEANLEKSDMCEMETASKQELVVKESKEKTKKDEKLKEEKKVKTNEKVEKDNKAKEKPATPGSAALGGKKAETVPTPDFLLYATFLNPPSSHPQCKFSDYKKMANTSEKLRQFGLCQYHSHPVHLNSVRICPLVAPPVPLDIPRWKLIRQKKTRELVEPKLRPEGEVVVKEPKFLEIKSSFFNYNLNKGDDRSSSHIISEEGQDEEEECPSTDLSTMESAPQGTSESEPESPAVSETMVSNVDAADASKKTGRSLSVSSSQGSQAKKMSKSKQQDARKSAGKDKGGSGEKKESCAVIIETPQTGEEEESLDIPSESNGTSLPAASEEENVEKEEEKDGEKESTVWMDFDDFLQCFSTLWIYHKPKKNIKNIADIKSFNQRLDKPRKSATTEVKNLQSHPSSIFGGISSDSSPPFLLLDCVNESEVVIHFSSLSRWFDPNFEFSLKRDGTESEVEAIRKASIPVPGTLVVEPYFWKQIVTPAPMLRMSTTGVKTSVLILPPGRHVLRFMINTPLGYHLCVTCANDFIFDDEHVVMQHLTKVSSRLSAHAIEVLSKLKVISQSFNDKSIPRSCGFIIGSEDKAGDIRKEHFDMLHDSLAAILKTELGEGFQPNMNLALNALKFESYFHIPKMTPDAKAIRSKSADVEPRPPLFDPTVKGRYSLPSMLMLNGSEVHEAAATRLQATFKGYYTRKLMMAYKQDSKENKIVTDMLDKIWTCIDLNLEPFATKLYTKLFEGSPHLYPLFPFYADECNKVNYNDYNGSYPEPPNTSWFLIFREIFYVLEANLIYTKFYCNIHNYQLKVIDNDTTEELKTLFSKVVPQILKKNKRGYTFVATSWNNSFVPGGKFRLRVIGENDSLPIPVKEGSVNTNFVTKEIRDYYLPNRYNRICRQTIKVSEDVLTSIQFTTCKEDVYIKLQVLDEEKVIYTCEGKRTLIIPALIFRKDRFPPVEESKNSRSSSRAGSIASISKGATSKQSSRKTSSPEKHKRKLLQLALNIEDEVSDEEVHKYIIEGFVLRDSWPLTRKEWIFAENQKNAEKLDKETSTDSVGGKVETVRGNSGKSRKNNRQESRAMKTRPPSQTQNTFDTTKANWTLRFIVDSSMENAIEIKRDTQRDEEIKAIKAAWETVEPGRSAKALQSRQKYLESHTIVVNDTTDEKEENASLDEDGVVKDKVDEEAASIATTEPTVASESPVPSEPDTGELFQEPPMKENLPVLMTFDTTPYIRSSGKKIILDEYEEEAQQGKLQRKFSNFHQVRETILQMRENNRIARNLQKERQIAEYEKMQIQLDESRIEIYKAREAYRKQFLPPEVDVETEVEKKTSPSPKAKASKSRARKK